jgi:hypothetical protein
MSVDLSELLPSIATTLERVDLTLPGMEAFTEEDCRWLIRCIEQGDLVYTISSLGWALWPTENRGYYDARLLRKLADFIEVQNKPMEEEYDRHCASLVIEDLVGEHGRPMPQASIDFGELTDG